MVFLVFPPGIRLSQTADRPAIRKMTQGAALEFRAGQAALRHRTTLVTYGVEVERGSDQRHRTCVAIRRMRKSSSRCRRTFRRSREPWPDRVVAACGLKVECLGQSISTRPLRPIKELKRRMMLFFRPRHRLTSSAMDSDRSLSAVPILLPVSLGWLSGRSDVRCRRAQRAGAFTASPPMAGGRPAVSRRWRCFRARAKTSSSAPMGWSLSIRVRER